MSGVNEKEIKTQERILHEIFEKKLGYTYLGNYEDRENNCSCYVLYNDHVAISDHSS